MNKRNSIEAQRGVATLIITVIVLLIISLVVLYAARVGVDDQRMAGNEARQKEAHAVAEAGLDFAVQRFVTNFNNNVHNTGYFPVCPGSVGYPTTASDVQGNAYSSGEAYFQVNACRVVHPTTSTSTTDYVTFASTGTGADGTATATVRRQVTMVKLLGGSPPDTPVIVAGSIGTGGDFNIVANPNGGGPGVPVSVWTGPEASPATATVRLSGSSATCHLQYFSGNNAQCPNPSNAVSGEGISTGDGTTLSSYSASYPDILPNDPNFPSDLFLYTFGVAHSDWPTVYGRAAAKDQVRENCDGLDEHAGEKYALWWITGDCDMGSTQVIGSKDHPVMLVIDDHDLEMRGTGRIYGFPYLFNNPTDGDTPGADMSGSPVIYGAFISEVGGNAMQGSYAIVYDPLIIETLNSEAGQNYDLAYIPGSWRDY